MKRLPILLAAGILLSGLIVLALWAAARQPESLAASVIAPAGQSSEGFARADGPRPLPFPESHGPHPDFQTEWWYFTGNLSDESGRRFGYQFTLFRRALRPPAERTDRDSAWAAEQLYLAHFTVTDVAGGDHYSFERWARGAAGLAGAQADPLRLWLEGWQVAQGSGDLWHIAAREGDIALFLAIESTKPPALQGDQGYSQKGPEAGNASYYYSLTRMASQGEIEIAGRTFAVEGWSWMDHEFSTSALSQGQVGWDWFSIQLDDNSELMLYYVRRADGSVDPLSKGSYIDAAGRVTPLSVAAGDFEIRPGRSWASEVSGAVYPIAWAIRVPSLDMTLELEALLPDQENRLSFAYWEGAVQVTGEREGQPLGGFGYVEMTGYATSMEGQF